ncbi:hypothetical protein RJ641_028594 [Dillenia turbinata]|uniref:Protein SCAR n=1 Tax=Dillenia turbinata TaxID=194707 RepID=A0AAN8ZMU1_9MAGN
MPLTRYQIKNEYGLADPELYRAADRDDPEALLEGVAMAGLIGVLRQLGDLAEFAAEIFHDLHEEVMATAARGHSLMVRIQQLETEFPSIEKAFLSQINVSSFFYSAGVEWHPNLQMDQNLITQGDLPRFVMDSYEECRGPPRLFLLDKFDVAGAGACLKRYTDPSFFKVEASSSEIMKADIQRERKTRKVKKRGFRRNGETPEVLTTSHAKLHQLFLEERVENGNNEPIHHAKLKRRQLNASPFDSKTGKSYMEKILEPPSPPSKLIREITVTPSNTSESRTEVLEISTISPAIVGPHSPPYSPRPELEHSGGELTDEVTDQEVFKELEADYKGDQHKLPATEQADERELVADGMIQAEGSADGYHSDDVMSEVDNYVDALTTVESEMETDTEFRPRKDIGFLNHEKRGTEVFANEEQKLPPQYSDSQSIGDSSASDDENSSFKKGRSSYSYSDTLSNLAENTGSDGDGAAKVFPSNEIYLAENEVSDEVSVDEEIQGCEFPEHATSSSGIQAPENLREVSELGEAFHNSILADSNAVNLSTKSAASSMKISIVGSQLDEISSIIAIGSTDTDGNGEDLNNNSLWTTAIVDVHPENHAVSHLDDDLQDGGSNLTSSGLLDMSNTANPSPEEEFCDDSNDEAQRVHVEENSSGMHINEKIESVDILPENAQLQGSDLPEIEASSGSTLLPQQSPSETFSNVESLNPDAVVLEQDDAVIIPATNSKTKTPVSDDSQLTDSHLQMEPEDDYRPHELDPAEPSISYSDHKENIEDILCMVDSEKPIESIAKVDVVEICAVPFDPPSGYPDDVDPVLVTTSGMHLDHTLTEKVQVNTCSATAEAVGVYEDCDDIHGREITSASEDLVYSPSRNVTEMQEETPSLEDLQQDEIAINKIPTPESHQGSEELQEVNRVEFIGVLDPGTCESVPCDTSGSMMLEAVADSFLADKSLDNIDSIGSTLKSSKESEEDPIQDAIDPVVAEEDKDYFDPSDIGTSNSSELRERGSYPPTQTPFEENIEDSVSSSCNFSESRIEAAPRSEADRLSLEPSCVVDEASSSLSHIQSEQIRTSNEIEQEISFGSPSDSESAFLPSKPTRTESPEQQGNHEVQSFEQVSDLLPAVLSAFPLLPDVKLEEMPPLPPLPPMQWRMGKFLQASVPTERVVQRNANFLPPFPPPTTNSKTQFGSPVSEGETISSLNMFMPSIASEDDKPHPVPPTGSMIQSSFLSSQLPAMSTDKSSQHDFSAFNDAQSSDLVQSMPEMSDKMPQNGLLATDNGMVQPDLIPSLLVPTVGDASPQHAAASVQEDLIRPWSLLPPEKHLEDEKFQQTPLKPDLDIMTSTEKLALQAAIEDDLSKHNVPNLEVETANSLDSSTLLPSLEDGKPNGTQLMKVPKPRDPLIEAVAAHDKRTLRKVVDRVRAQNRAKADERDSLLEQIRTKSFNLKPAVPNRPNIQGPKTNLKVAAILEKANAIRQALAGSEEDDDDDTWSDT